MKTSKLFIGIALAAGGFYLLLKMSKGKPTEPNPDPVLSRINISPSSANVAPGGQQQITATCYDENDATTDCPTLYYKSTNTSTATVDNNGLVQVPSGATSGSSACIRASDDPDFTPSCTP